jgi:TatD DNase family protein
VLRTIEPRHIVLETDSPYLAPVPYRGKRNEPAYVPLVAKKLAEVKDLPPERVMEITTENALRLFNSNRTASVHETQ